MFKKLLSIFQKSDSIVDEYEEVEFYENLYCEDADLEEPYDWVNEQASLE